MWERFSYFGMASLLVLYLVKYLLLPGQAEGVLGYARVKGALESVFGTLEPQPLASQIFGFYTGFAYLTPILGGYLADRVLGQRRTAIIGALLMAVGHFLMAFEALLFVALALPHPRDRCVQAERLDAGRLALRAGRHAPRLRAYSIYYVGINIGAFLAPLVSGTLGGEVGWHYGFAAAGVGMLIGLAIYLFGHAPPAARRAAPREARRPTRRRSCRRAARDRRRSSCVFALVTLFWATYDQQGNTLLLWVEDHTERSHRPRLLERRDPDHLVPRAQSADDLRLHADPDQAVGAGRPPRHRDVDHRQAGVRLLVRRARQCRDGGGRLALRPAAKASPLWLVGYFVVVTIGELHLAPVGLALVSRIAPARVLSLMMGLWFAATFPGDVLGGWLGGFWSTMDKRQFLPDDRARSRRSAGVAMLALQPAAALGVRRTRSSTP